MTAQNRMGAMLSRTRHVTTALLGTAVWVPDQGCVYRAAAADRRVGYLHRAAGNAEGALLHLVYLTFSIRKRARCRFGNVCRALDYLIKK